MKNYYLYFVVLQKVIVFNYSFSSSKFIKNLTEREIICFYQFLHNRTTIFLAVKYLSESIYMIIASTMFLTLECFKGELRFKKLEYPKIFIFNFKNVFYSIFIYNMKIDSQVF